MTETTNIKAFSERARESALRVRRHQSALGGYPGGISPAIAARVKEILAGKKGKGHAAKPKAPKQTAEQKKQAKQDAIDNNRSAIYDKTGLSDAGVDAVNALESGEQPKDAGDLLKSGLAEKDSEGKVRLSAAGHAFLNAADKGDAGAAQEALSKGKDKGGADATRDTAKTERVAKQVAKKDEATKKKQVAVAKHKDVKPKAAAKPAANASNKPAAAAHAAKPTAGHSSSGGARAASAPAPAVVRAKNVTAIGESTGLGDHLANLDKFKGGKDLSDADAAELEKRGLVERADDGTPRMSAAGTALIAAAARGDTRAALDAVSRAKDKVAKKAIDMEEELPLAIKAGRRHSQMDASHLDEAARHLHSAGATCPDCAPGDEEDDADVSASAPAAAIKGIMDDPGYYAQHECGDIGMACNALQTLAMLIQSELIEEDEDDAQVQKLCDAAETLIEFIQGELKELRGAAEDDASTIGHEPMKAVDQEAIKAVNYDQASQLVRDAWAQANPNPSNGLASWPIAVFDDGIIISNQGHMARVPYQRTEDHITFSPQADWEEVRQVYMTADGREIKAVPDQNIVNLLIDTAVEDLHRNRIPLDFAVKSIGDSDEISGPAIRYGSASEPDISRERDFFTKSTNFWLDAWDKRPMIWHHALPQDDLIRSLQEAGAADGEIKAMREAITYLDAHPMIGTWTKAVADPATVWMNGILDKAHRYRSAIKRMVELGMLKISTDSLPQLVVRERQPNGTHEVKSWPIVAASLTPTAAEPRLLDVSSMKLYYEEAGIAFPFDEVAEVKTDNSTRSRALLLELELLELETV